MGTGVGWLMVRNSRLLEGKNVSTEKSYSFYGVTALLGMTRFPQEEFEFHLSGNLYLANWNDT